MIRTRAVSAAALVALAPSLAAGGWTAPAHADAPSTTTLVLSKVTSAYGDTVSATAQVVTSGPANGKVWFAVDDVSVMASINSAGTASLTLPRTVPVGAHAVSATFVPRYPDQQQGSASPTTTWVVNRARTQLQVRVTGRGAHVRTGVVAVATGDFGTRPSGVLTATVKNLATKKVTRRQRTLDGSGSATASFGVLRTGRYRLRVTYAGDGQHLVKRHSEKFTVRQH